MVHYTTHGTCSRQIDFDIDAQGRISHLDFVGGCDGNLRAISKLVTGADASYVADLLAGNRCGSKPTSCADQLSQAIRQELSRRA